MDQYASTELCGLFHALGDPSRMVMMQRLSQGDAVAGELAQRLNITLTATLKHMRVLERAGLASTVKVGRERRCHLQVESLREIENWIEDTRRTWMFRLDRLEDFLKLPEDPI